MLLGYIIISCGNNFIFSFLLNHLNPNKIKRIISEKTKILESSDAPSLDENENFQKLTRKEALSESDRISFENDNVIGSINLIGATIDDLTFKNYDVELNGNKKLFY